MSPTPQSPWIEGEGWVETSKEEGKPLWVLFAWAGYSMLSWTLGSTRLLSACRKEVEQLCAHLPEEFFKEQRWCYFSTSSSNSRVNAWGSFWVRSLSVWGSCLWNSCVHRAKQDCKARRPLKQAQEPSGQIHVNWCFTEVAHKQKIIAKTHCVPSGLLNYIYIYLSHLYISYLYHIYQISLCVSIF